MAARFKAQVCGRSPAEIVGSNPSGGMEVSVVNVVCYKVEVSTRPEVFYQLWCVVVRHLQVS